MNKLLAAVAVSATLVAPAFAQMPTFTEEQVAAAAAAIEELGLDDTTYQELWCGAAFVNFGQYLTSQGDTAGAADAEQKSGVLFDKVGAKLVAENYSQQELEAIGTNASIVALTQLQAGEEEFTQDACIAAAQAQ